MWSWSRSQELGGRSPLLQNVDHHPRLDVLFEALGNQELLAPLDVVTNGLGVYARPCDVELVEDLDGLELEDSCPRHVTQHDVLGELAVRPGRRADGSPGWSTEERR
ncbi:hypothetical protein BMS3Bbin02_02073 [bacterium BMS3Bbin02]|nr:hypothetical protein BMS3Bbin02_02073 [bacterium BMS3Bbin02]